MDIPDELQSDFASAETCKGSPAPGDVVKEGFDGPIYYEDGSGPSLVLQPLANDIRYWFCRVGRVNS
ncbi:MAG: hypothetical protein KDJ63_16000, partial [Nitratireductor sp.]|nr:hypothetical protein [Nitratireductor sp.]